MAFGEIAPKMPDVCFALCDFEAPSMKGSYNGSITISLYLKHKYIDSISNDSSFTMQRLIDGLAKLDSHQSTIYDDIEDKDDCNKDDTDKNDDQDVEPPVLQDDDENNKYDDDDTNNNNNNNNNNKNNKNNNNNNNNNYNNNNNNKNKRHDNQNSTNGNKSGGTVCQVSTLAEFNKIIQKQDVKLTVVGFVESE